jgi:hypothetical protein
MFSKNRMIGLSIMAFITSVWAMAWPISKALPGAAFSEPVGSVYNGLNVLFTALAFGGVIITLLFQAEEAKHARREEIERSIFDLFQTFTSHEFQEVKNGAFRALLAGVQNEEYAHFLASRLYAVDQLPFPVTVIPILRALDESKAALNEAQIEQADRADRLMLDNVLNFFALLAQRKSSSMVIKHCDFAYDWWRPTLWLVALLQQEHFQKSKTISLYCRTRMIAETLVALDKIYGHTPLTTPLNIRHYIDTHPKILMFRSKPDLQSSNGLPPPVEDLKPSPIT